MILKSKVTMPIPDLEKIGDVGTKSTFTELMTPLSESFRNVYDDLKSLVGSILTVDDVTIQNSSNVISVKNGGITAAKLATDAVETLKIKAENVTAAKLATDAVETAKIKAKNVTSAKLEDDLAFGTFPTTPNAAPDADLEVANKKYVDDEISGISVPDYRTIFTVSKQDSTTSTSFITVFKGRWIKNPDVETIKIRAYMQNSASDGWGYTKITVGSANYTLGCNGLEALASYDLDVSSLTDGTEYDLIAEIRTYDSGNTTTLLGSIGMGT